MFRIASKQRPRAATGRHALAALVAALAALIFAAPAPAIVVTPTNDPLPGSTFQGGDGDEYNPGDATLGGGTAPGPAGAIDWHCLADALCRPLGTQVTATNDPDANDSIFDTGSHENDPEHWDLSTIADGSTPAKANFFASWNYVDNDRFLDLAFDREESGGNVFLAFELNQDTRTWKNASNDFIHCRTTNDVIVSYEIQNDDNIDVVIQKWVTDTAVTPADVAAGYTNGLGCAKTGHFVDFDPGPTVQGAINTARQITNYLPHDPAATIFGEELFGEAAVDLTAVFQQVLQEPCFSFGQINLHGRSSESSSAAMQDLVGPTPLIVRNCTISGTKWHDLDGDGVMDAGEPPIEGYRIDLDDDDANSNPNATTLTDADGRYVFADLDDGTYTITEAPDANQALALRGFTCSYPTAASTPPAGATAGDCAWTATLSAGRRNVTGLDFGNFITPKVTVVKQTVPDGSAGSFAFSSTIPGHASFSLSDGGAEGPVAVNPGSYTATETVPAGWTLTSVACSGDTDSTGSVANARATFNVTSAEDVTCTFTNTGNASVTVVKDAVPNDAQDFAFTTTGSGLSGFSLDDDANATLPGSRTFPITPDQFGAKSITEAVTTGWVLTGLACSGDADAQTSVASRRADLDVDAGEAITCTFTNTKGASVTIVKDAVPDDAQDFDFDGSGTAIPADFDLDDDADGTLPNAITFAIAGNQLGAKSISESLTPGWRLTALSCSGDADARTSVADRTVDLDVDTDETIVCTFQNTKLARIEIEKQTDPDETGGTTFGFTSAGLVGSSDLTQAGFALPDDGVEAIADVEPNAGGAPYTVAEDAATGYRLTAIDCGGDGDTSADTGTRTASIHVSPGEAVHCTFTNLRLNPSLAVTKDGPAQAHHGDQLTYTFAVRNTGNSPLQNVHVTDDRCSPVTAEPTEKRNDNGDGLLDAIGQDGVSPEIWVFSCTTTAPAQHAAGEEDPIHDTGTATADDEQGNPVSPATDDHLTDLVHPAIAVDKTLRAGSSGEFVEGPVFAYVGDTLEYRFTVTNPGDIKLTVNAIDDARCDAGTLAGPAEATGNADAFLDPGEAWVWSCTHAVAAGDGDPVHNVVTVTGTDTIGGQVTDTDAEDADILHPAIDIEKGGPATAQAGDRIAYGLVVTNPGDVVIVGETLSITDPLCDAPPVPAGKLRDSAADPTPDTLDPGDTWSYTCAVPTAVGQASVLNMASANGVDVHGRPVSDSDQFPTALTQPAVVVAGVTVASGAAKLTGPSKCVNRKFTAKVTGKRIRSVVWRIDGRKVKTFTSRTGEARRVTFRVNPARYGRGVHRLTATVRFNPASQTRGKTLRMTFQACERTRIAPAFTG